MLATLDKFGRVLISKKIREHLGISSDSPINIINEDTRVIIEPINETEPLVEKDGLIVFTGKIQENPEVLLNRDRSRRIKKWLSREE